MKKIFLLLLTAMVSLGSHAQIEDDAWYVIPKLGVGVADMTSAIFDAKKAEVNQNATLKPMTTFTGGVEFMYGLTDQLGLSFGLMYARQGSKTDNDLFKIKMDYVNIPLTIDFYPIPKAGLCLKAGVQVGFVGHKSKTINGVEYDADYVRKFLRTRRGDIAVYAETEMSREFNKVDFSIPLAISYELYNFTLEARYNLGLTKVMKNDPESSKHRVWQFTLGYKIPLDND